MVGYRIDGEPQEVETGRWRTHRPDKVVLLRHILCLFVILFSDSRAFAAGPALVDAAVKDLSDPTTQEDRAVFDPDARPSRTFQVNPRLSLAGKLDISVENSRNKDLDNALPDDLLAIEPKLRLFGFYQSASGIDLIGEVRSTYLHPFEDDVARVKAGSGFELGEAYLLWPNPFKSAMILQIGRQRFKDNREWWYDDELDALRVLYKKDRLGLDFSVSARLIDVNGDTRNNFMANGNYRLHQGQKLAIYAISRRDRRDSTNRPFWYGLSWRGKPYEGNKAWVDLGVMRGKKDSETLKGAGWDAGWVFRFNRPLQPSFTVASAYGSGDGNPNDGVNTGFRQTGLEDNNGVFGGITKFKYYGEVLRPELNNLSILTGGFGIRPVETFSFDVVYHHYQQSAKNKQARFGLKELPTGKNPDIGQEVNIILGVKITEQTRVSFRAGLFNPGQAYIKQDKASSGKLEVQYVF